MTLHDDSTGANDSAFLSQVFNVDGELAGGWRSPRQLLAHQTYDSHASIHDDATAQTLGFAGGTIEGPTHFSQLARLGAYIWGARFLEQGCLSVHFRNPAYEGDEVRAYIEDVSSEAHSAAIRMVKADGTEVLTGTASTGAVQTALEKRLANLPPLEDPIILRNVRVGMRTQRQAVTMNFDQHMGEPYPFSLRDKLKVITEPSAWYEIAPQYGGAIIPFEMISVLMQYVARQAAFPVKGPCVSLFADQEIKLFEGPLIVGRPYEIEREVVALSGSRRTESLWVRTTLYEPGSQDPKAAQLLNYATLKSSFAPYDAELRALKALP